MWLDLNSGYKQGRLSGDIELGLCKVTYIVIKIMQFLPQTLKTREKKEKC